MVVKPKSGDILNKVHPETYANVFSKLFFCWMVPVFRKGYATDIETDDLWDTHPDVQSKVLSDQLEKLWKDELVLARRQGRNPAFVKSLIRQFRGKIWIGGIALFVEEILKILQAVFMGGLIQYFRFDSNLTIRTAYLYAFGVAVTVLTFALSHHYFFYTLMRVGFMMRIATSGLIFKKSLRLNNKSLQETSAGKIVNIMSNDLQRFEMVVPFMHYIWIAPLSIVFYMLFVSFKMGYSGFTGFFVLLCTVPLSGFFSLLMGKFRQRIAAFTDRRVGIMSEILAGIRVIKMYGWEVPFSGLIDEARRDELRKVMMTGVFQGLLFGTFFAAIKVAIFFAVLVYVCTGHVMNAEVVFVTASVLNSARLSVTLFLPLAFQFTRESMVSIRRIQEFLLLSEVETLAIDTEPATANGTPAQELKLVPKLDDASVAVTNLSAMWEPDQPSVTLEGIYFDAKPGDLIAIVGPVGAGKSSLFNALLQEMIIVDGSVVANGKIAYVAQQAWIFSASLRENIIFGKKFDPSKYKAALHYSALKKDIDLMPSGDSTVVGDRGVQLSGGQKARINLARALYHDGDIYLLDDPLSAVDSTVGRHIFEKCICGYLNNKVCLLITHQLQWLRQCSRVILLKQGKIVAQGRYDDLLKLGDEFTALIQETEQSYVQLETQRSIDSTLCGGGSSSPIDESLHGLRRRLTSQMSTTGAVAATTPTYMIKENDDDQLNDGLLLSNDDRVDSYRVAIVDHLSPVKRVQSIGASVWSLVSGLEGERLNSDLPPEERSVGAVSWAVYFKYFTSMGNPVIFTLLIIFFVFVQAVMNFSDWWLNIWINHAEFNSVEERLQNASMINDFDQWFKLNRSHALLEKTIVFPHFTPDDYLEIYAVLIFSLCLLSVLRTTILRYLILLAGKKLHREMFNSIMRAPVLFFDQNPIGRVLNRFTKDMNTVDEQLAFVFLDFVSMFIMMIGSVLVIGFINPYVMIATVPLLIGFLFLRAYYLRTARDVKRLESSTRSPVYSHVSASLYGISTIRAYDAQSITIGVYHDCMDIHSSAFILALASARWLGLVVDWISATFVCLVAFLSVVTAQHKTSGDVGLSMFYALTFLGAFSWFIRQSAEVETCMVSVERVREYISTRPEAELEISKTEPAEDWPQYGHVVFKNVYLKYAPTAPYVLRNIDTAVHPGEKVGIVGRTGAGKSSLIGLLFRLYEPEGSVLIDGVDIMTLGLHRLRQALSIIPQDPVLFVGTLRKNLDPFQRYSDAQLWKALERVELKVAVEEMVDKLETNVTEGGSNLSVGQKQLVCLARALLVKTKILVVDEATANVDLNTDALIQQTIRSEFRYSTVLTIAHRLDTIMDYDRVMVLKDGEMLEFDTPFALLQSKESSFSSFVNETGTDGAKKLYRLAQHAEQIRNAGNNKE